ncbi:helix-turn-helix domain-containing protein [Nocardia sp. NPDC088792]|uniref:helix-turn-helix domain-containing protein n=1 Tax=Nocardia sp. NPDC088792 TaxID=3364332 RepID=UPI00380B724C
MSEKPRLTAIPGGREDRPREARRGAAREPLWREALGEQLRTLRLGQGEKLTETAGRAGISPQYLSEVERGRKEPSSEMIAALAGALGTTLWGLTQQVAEELHRRQLAAYSRPTTHRPASGPVMLALVA